MSSHRHQSRIEGRIEMLRAPAPRLTDFHLAPDEVTEELPKDESMFELVRDDRAHVRGQGRRS